MNIPVYVLTSEKYLWSIQAFAYLFNVYWSSLQEVIVVSDVKPKFELPDNFKIRTMNNDSPLPKEKWSDGLIVMLENIQDQHFVLMLEDYWLVRGVDHQAVGSLADYASIHGDILRVDLTDDRQYAGDMYDIGYWGRLDLVATPPDSPYQVSLQAAIWNRDLLVSLVRPDLSPWEFELYLSPALHGRDDIKVIGTRQRPVRYANVFKGGDPGKVINLEGIPEEHVKELRKRKWLAG